MPATRHGSRILTVEIVGFVMIIALSWANELLGLPSVIFGGGHRVNWPESVLETVFIALVAIPVLLLTRRLVLRLHYLEEFMRVCAWCRKLSVGSEWIPLEEFFERKFDTVTSHAMCPTCLIEQRAKVRRAS
jgi:ABC-type dipeptide/oligopeptide/nickel transport system permease component